VVQRHSCEFNRLNGLTGKPLKRFWVNASFLITWLKPVANEIAAIATAPVLACICHMRQIGSLRSGFILVYNFDDNRNKPRSLKMEDQ
jgi:hypothetical protein